MTNPVAALAQDAGENSAQQTVFVPPEAASSPDKADQTDEQIAPAAKWTAALSGGLSARDNGPKGIFEIASLSRRIGRAYVGGSVTRYKSTLQQSDVALPSTYSVASLAAGGNFNNWVVDGYASLGWQNYGQVRTSTGVRASTAGSGSLYFASGLTFGKVVQPWPNWYVTPTLGVQFAKGKLLRPAPQGLDAKDFETDEPTWTGAAGLRIDHRFGKAGQHLVGLSLSHRLTNNGLSQLAMPAPPAPGSIPAMPTGVSAVHTPDGWQELGVSTSFHLNKAITLEAGATRSIGAIAGDSLGFSLGVQLHF